jgi:hypothetical protein
MAPVQLDQSQQPGGEAVARDSANMRDCQCMATTDGANVIQPFAMSRGLERLRANRAGWHRGERMSESEELQLALSFDESTPSDSFVNRVRLTICGANELIAALSG